MKTISHNPPPENGKNNQPPPPRPWRPGEALPKNYDPDPWAALVRNAAAHERHLEEQAARRARQRRAA